MGPSITQSLGPKSAKPGILTRFRALARRIKTAPAYTEATGEALGIVGPETTGPDLANITPEISLRTTGGQVEVLWKKQGMEAIEIQKDSGSGWQLLALDTRPNYIDTTPFPTPAATWKYRAIYCEDSQKVGQWSNVAEISVGGKTNNYSKKIYTKIYSVDDVQLAILKIHPPTLCIVGTGVVISGDWAHPQLIPYRSRVSRNIARGLR